MKQITRKFTRAELFFYWIPAMVIAAIVFSLMVMNGAIDLPVGGLLLGITGVILKWAARWVNLPAAPAAPAQEEGVEQ